MKEYGSEEKILDAVARNPKNRLRFALGNGASPPDLEKFERVYRYPRPLPDWVKPALIILGLWGMGGTIVIYLSGLQDVPISLLEAAELDGASWWQRLKSAGSDPNPRDSEARGSAPLPKWSARFAEIESHHAELLKTAIEGMEGKEAIVYVAELPPGAAAGKHTHPGPEFAYVLDGALTLEPQGQAPKTYKAGEVFHNAAKIVHDAKNASTTGPTKVLVFLLAEKGQPLATPAP
jgi:quercetin dioxygenase-like cupin family protein